MSRNGHDGSADELKREADAHRKAIKQTASELQERIREKKEQVEEAIDRTREKMSGVDDFITRHHLALLGGAVGVGLLLGARGGGSRTGIGELPDGGRYVLVEKRQSHSILKSLFGALVALGARQGMTWLTSKLEASDEYEERPFLSRTRTAGLRDDR